MTTNKPDTIIADLIRQNQELTLKLERAYFKNRQQRTEIRRLNSAHINKNNLINKRQEQILSLTQLGNEEKDKIINELFSFLETKLVVGLAEETLARQATDQPAN